MASDILKYKYPSITDPGNTDAELRQTVRQLAEAVRILTGQGEGAAVSVRGLAGSLNVEPGGWTGHGFPPDWVEEGLRRYNLIFDQDLTDLHELVTTETGEALNDFQAALIQDLPGYTVTINGQVTTFDSAISEMQDIVVTGVTHDAFGNPLNNSALSGRIQTISAKVDIPDGLTFAGIVGSTSITKAQAGEAMATTINNVSAVASKARTFISATPPNPTLATTPPTSGLVVGDIWIDTAHSNQLKVWNGTSWVDARDQLLNVAYSSITDTNFVHTDGQKSVAEKLSSLIALSGAGGQAAITDDLFAIADPTQSIVGRLGKLRAAAYGNISSIVTTLGGSVTEAGAISGMTTDISTTVGTHTSSINSMMLSVDGTRVAWGIAATLDGRAGGGVRFTSVRRSDGTADAKFVIDGDLDVINGTITGTKIKADEIDTTHLKAGAITASKLSIATGQVNLIKNGDFQDGAVNTVGVAPGWANGGGAGTFHITGDPGNTFSGDRALRVQCVSVGDQYVDSDWTPVQENTNYDLSCYTAIATGSTSNSMNILWGDINKTQFSGIGAAGGVINTAGWQQIKIRVTTPPNTRWAKVQLHTNAPSGGTGYFDVVSLRRVIGATGIDIDGVDLSNILDGSASSVSVFSTSSTNIGPVGSGSYTFYEVQNVPSLTVVGSGRIVFITIIRCNNGFAFRDTQIRNPYMFSLRLNGSGSDSQVVYMPMAIKDVVGAAPGNACDMDTQLLGSCSLAFSATLSPGVNSFKIIAGCPPLFHSGSGANFPGANFTENVTTVVIQSRR
jgi:hypothetical protein